MRLANVTVYGEFTAGRHLASAFSKKAVGAQDSMVAVIDSHIQVVNEMQAVFRKFFVDYADTEQNNSSAINQAGPK